MAKRKPVCVDCGEEVKPIKIELLARIIIPKRCDECWEYRYKAKL